MTTKRSALVLICALAALPAAAQEPAKSPFLIELERQMQQAADCAADKQEAERRRLLFGDYAVVDPKDGAANNYDIKIDRARSAPKLRCQEGGDQ